MNAPIRLLAVSHNLNLEGASFAMYELMGALKLRGLVEPCIMSFAPGPLAELYRDAEMRLVELPFDAQWLKSSDRIGAVIRALSGYIAEKTFDLVYANTLLGYPAIHAAADADCPSVWNIHESQDLAFWQDYLGDRLQTALTAFGRSQAVVFVAQATRELWEKRIAIPDSYCIPNAFNAEHFAQRFNGTTRAGWRRQLGIPPEAVVALCVGTVHERKGQMDLIRAVAEMPSSADPIAAVCVGDGGGPYSDEIRAWITNLPEERRRRIHLLPKTFFVGDAYRAADVFVCCSRNESYPRVILEAMSAGLAVVTTPVFGIAEQVRFDETALAYEPEDWRGLQALLLELASDASRRQELGQKGKARLATLSSVDAMTEQYAQVMQKSL